MNFVKTNMKKIFLVFIILLSFPSFSECKTWKFFHLQIEESLSYRAELKRVLEKQIKLRDTLNPFFQKVYDNIFIKGFSGFSSPNDISFSEQAMSRFMFDYFIHADPNCELIDYEDLHLKLLNSDEELKQFEDYAKELENLLKIERFGKDEKNFLAGFKMYVSNSKNNLKLLRQSFPE